MLLVAVVVVDVVAVVGEVLLVGQVVVPAVIMVLDAVVDRTKLKDLLSLLLELISSRYRLTHLKPGEHYQVPEIPRGVPPVMTIRSPALAIPDSLASLVPVLISSSILAGCPRFIA